MSFYINDKEYRFLLILTAFEKFDYFLGRQLGHKIFVDKKLNFLIQL